MFVYLIGHIETGLCKIGVSKNPNKRIKTLSTGCPYPIKIIYQHKSNHPFKIETAVHKRYYDCKNDDILNSLSGEWFILSLDRMAQFPIICEEIEKAINTLKKNNNPFI